MPSLAHLSPPHHLHKQFKDGFNLAVDFVGADAGLLGSCHQLIFQVTMVIGSPSATMGSCLATHLSRNFMPRVLILATSHLDAAAARPRVLHMARGNIKVGDEVAVTAVVRGRVTPDRVSVTIPSYNFPHSVVDSTLKAVIGQNMEVTGTVTRVDGDKVTVSLRPLVTVDAEYVRLVESYVAPKGKTRLVDKA
ncbi:hypothetical protein [Mesorhizobium sp. M0589]|uniref:hypothetical protein n=2 Tax=Mesorhizobium TaxID=68287 RepID=UPI003336EF40